MSSRREAIFIITRWLATQDFPDRLISDGPDRGFVTDLVYTTVRHRRTLEWLLGRLLKKMPRGETQAALLVGAAQVVMMPDVTAYAAVNETVEAAKLASKRTSALVNGVLRNLLRQRDALCAELAQASIGIRTSHPDALVTRWLKPFGPEETLSLCTWNNLPAETVLAWSPDAAEPFTIAPRGTRIETLPGYAEGRFIVQDPATAPAIDLLDLKPGLRVLDACAAPGGKTIQMAWRMGVPATPSSHQLVALDRHADRLLILRENLERTRQTWVVVEQGDLTTDAPALLDAHGLFDRILLDAPCSNSGVLRRRPDARWRWSTKRMKQLTEIQARLLTQAVSLLAPNGRLVYSTCSLEPEENRRQISQIRKRFPELVCAGVVENIPTRSHTDGAFACALDRCP